MNPPFDPLARAALASPDAPALRDGGRWVSFGELSAQVEAHAGVLRRAGAVPGQRVAVVVGSSATGIRALHAAFRTGATVVPLHSGLTAAELVPVFTLLRPAAVVAEEPSLYRMREATRDLEGAIVVEVAGDGPRPVTPPRGSPPAPATLPGAAVLWTSGTSGAPRAILLTGRAFEANAAASAARLGLEASDRWMASLNPAHVGGLALILRAALLGSAVVPLPRFDMAELLAGMEEAGVTHASLVPTQLHRVADALEGGRSAPASLRAVLLGGAAAPPPLVRAAGVRGVPVAVTYGLTEATSQVATATPEESQADPASPGRPLDCVELRVDPDGGLHVRGPTLAAGRLQAEDDGADGGFRVAPLVDRDGWLDTGDMGRLDEEGRLHVTGRRSDRIISGGVNVDPMEVEGVLLAHPSVVEAAVVGVSDPEWGERVVAAVALRSDGPFPGAEALSAYLKGRLAGPKRPKELRVVQALPRNANGKVDRAAVRSTFRSAESA